MPYLMAISTFKIGIRC